MENWINVLQFVQKLGSLPSLRISNSYEEEEVLLNEQRYSDCKSELVEAWTRGQLKKEVIVYTSSTKTKNKKAKFKSFPQTPRNVNENRTKERKDRGNNTLSKKNGGILSEDIDGKKETYSNDCVLLSSKITKYGILYWLFLFLCMTQNLNGVNASQFQQGVVVKRLLTTKKCNQRNFYSLNSFCHKDEYQHNLTIFNCNFDKHCDIDENPVCLNTDERGVFVCQQKDITCPKGRMIIAWQDNQLSDFVNLRESDCPNKRFQPGESDCVHACLFLHRNVSDISEKYTISSEGDNIRPTTVYCNFKKGYYNAEGKLYLNYDQDEKIITDLCHNVADKNPCMKNEFPLPDGHCVPKCKNGFERNPPDFHCRKSDKIGISSTTEPSIGTAELSPASTTRSPTTSDITDTTKSTSTSEGISKTHAKPEITNNEAFPWWGYLFSCLGAILVLVLLIAVIFIVWKLYILPESREVSIHRERNNTYRIDYATNVYINGNPSNPLIHQNGYRAVGD